MKTLKHGIPLTTIGLVESSGLAFAPSRTHNAATTSQSAKVSTTASPSRIPAPPSLRNSVKIGLGVGIPVGVGLVILLVISIRFRTRKARDKMRDKHEIDPASDPHEQPGSTVTNYGSMGYAPQELGEPERKAERGELAS